jgi:hypothetical protein
MRILIALLVAGMGSACASSRDAPRLPVKQEPSAWALDKQPVPRTLDEALVALQRGLGEPTIARLRIAEEDVAITLVPTLGRWMQEHWGLATGGPLGQYFEARGLDRPDDMAAVILTSLWRTLHYRNIRLDEQIAWYRATRRTGP